MSLLLYIVAWLLKIYLAPLLVVSGFVLSLVNKQFNSYCLNCAVATDKFGNVIGGPLWNILLRKSGGHDFGNWQETISLAMAYNKRNGTLSGFGKLLEKCIDIFDPNHLEKTFNRHVTNTPFNLN